MNDIKANFKDTSQTKPKKFLNFSSKFNPSKLKKKRIRPQTKNSVSASQEHIKRYKRDKNEKEEVTAFKIFGMTIFQNPFSKTMERPKEAQFSLIDDEGSTKRDSTNQGHQSDKKHKSYKKSTALAFSDSKGINSLVKRYHRRSISNSYQRPDPKEFEESIETRRAGYSLANKVTRTEPAKMKPCSKFPCKYRHQSQSRFDQENGGRRRVKHVSSFSDFIKPLEGRRDNCPALPTYSKPETSKVAKRIKFGSLFF